MWFVLVAVAGWGLHLWHGVVRARDATLCLPVTGNPYRTGPPAYACRVVR
jgi:hypothetical protein